MLEMTVTQAKERLERILREAMEVLDFAAKHNRLDLYRAAEIDCAAYLKAIEVLTEKEKSLQPILPK
jgi:hypothetical protein